MSISSRLITPSTNLQNWKNAGFHGLKPSSKLNLKITWIIGSGRKRLHKARLMSLKQHMIRVNTLNIFVLFKWKEILYFNKFGLKGLLNSQMPLLETF